MASKTIYANRLNGDSVALTFETNPMGGIRFLVDGAPITSTIEIQGTLCIFQPEDVKV
jgi:hypothetical protein